VETLLFLLDPFLNCRIRNADIFNDTLAGGVRFLVEAQNGGRS
jgi:hypothetical protein